MKLFIIIAIISLINNLLITYDEYVLMTIELLNNDFVNILKHSNLFDYIKYVYHLIIFWLFFDIMR
jgi:hypothetical protein